MIPVLLSTVAVWTLWASTYCWRNGLYSICFTTGLDSSGGMITHGDHRQDQQGEDPAPALVAPRRRLAARSPGGRTARPTRRGTSRTAVGKRGGTHCSMVRAQAPDHARMADGVPGPFRGPGACVRHRAPAVPRSGFTLVRSRRSPIPSVAARRGASEPEALHPGPLRAGRSLTFRPMASTAPGSSDGERERRTPDSAGRTAAPPCPHPASPPPGPRHRGRWRATTGRMRPKAVPRSPVPRHRARRRCVAHVRRGSGSSSGRWRAPSSCTPWPPSRVTPRTSRSWRPRPCHRRGSW